MIYHLATEDEFRLQVRDSVYRPVGLADVGFVHCASEPSVIPVANDYFAEATESVLVLEIDPERLSSETRYEVAAPIEGGGTTHLAGAELFPHVYGPINCDAITGVGVLARNDGGYVWPDGLVPLSVFLEEEM